jgi:hypothetical protein
MHEILVQNIIIKFKKIKYTTDKMSGENKQRQIPQSSQLLHSFKTTTNLAIGLTKERHTIQNEL